jgi:Rrf2 family protein
MMQLSTKARYAARALVELALQHGRGPVKLKDIADKQNISLKYLEQVMTPLRVYGYVKTQKGSRGGYILARPPEQVNLFEVVQCVEGSLALVDCLDSPELCERVKLCATRDAWMSVKEAICKELSSITLADLAEKQSFLYKENQ